MTNLVYPGNKTVKYFYDSLNRLTNVTDWASRQTTFTYDLASRVKTISRPNGTQRIINYDAAGQTTNIIEQTIGGNVIAFFKLNWNNAARVQWEFGAPLPHASTPPTRTMTFDDDNRLATFNGSTITNDLDGNMTWGPLTNITLTSYAYDARNRLVSAGGINYGYDSLGIRTVLTNGATVTKFVINPNGALSQLLFRSKNGVTNYYVFGLGLLYEADESGNTKTYHYDYRGSTMALTDSSGNVTDRIEYSTSGLTTYRIGSTDTPFLFNGRYGVQTDANGLLYMRARYYNAYVSRFINPDPAGFSGGLNFYTYAGGNPVSCLDPFGLSPLGESTSVWDQFKNLLITGDTWWQRPLYTGEMHPSEDVLAAATTEAGSYAYYYGAARGFFVGAGTGGKLSSGTYSPGYAAAGELNWTIDGGYGGQLGVGGGLQNEGKHHSAWDGHYTIRKRANRNSWNTQLG